MQETRAYLDKNCISQFISGKKTIALRFNKYTFKKKTIIDGFVNQILESVNNHQWKNQIEYCIDELVSNAVKANLKRNIFAMKNLDLNDPDQYAEGMGFFKDMAKNGNLTKLMKNHDPLYYVKIIFAIQGESLVITVFNNSRLNYYEEVRMFEKRSIAKESASLSDILLTTNDEAEGSGLGLVVMLFMLKRIGLPEAFSFYNKNGGTYTVITIPLAFTYPQ